MVEPENLIGAPTLNELQSSIENALTLADKLEASTVALRLSEALDALALLDR